MSHQEGGSTEAQKKAAAFLTRPKPNFKQWRTAQEVTAKKEAAEAMRVEAAEKAAAEKATAEEKAKAVENAEVGDTMPDGTIYAGISPDTNERMYAAPTDASLLMQFKNAAKYASKLNMNDHKDWRVPTKGEMNVLFQNQGKGALQGTFNPATWYWSSTPFNHDGAWGQDTRSGLQDYNNKNCALHVRVVR